MRHLVWGLVAAAVVVVVVWVIWGVDDTGGAAIFALVAAGIHGGAVRLLEPALVPPYDRLWKRWAAGLTLRVAGVALLAAAMLALPERFPALPTAVGFLGVLIPSLFSEMRLVWTTLQAGR